MIHNIYNMDILNISISLSVFLVIVLVLAMISLYIYYLFNHLKNEQVYKHTSCIYIDTNVKEVYAEPDKVNT